jgi:uncharacterized protein (TIGR03382 family)
MWKQALDYHQLLEADHALLAGEPDFAHAPDGDLLEQLVPAVSLHVRGFQNSLSAVKTLGMLTLLCAAAALGDTLDPATGLKSTNVLTGLGPVTDFGFLPDGRILFTQKTGDVKIFEAPSAVKLAGTFIVNPASEQGLLGVAIDPAFATSHTLFFYYSADVSIGGSDTDRHRVVSITLKSDDTLDMASEKILVRGLRGPANHDGGALAIGPDGKLYIGVGDTGCNCDCAPGGADNTFATCLTGGNGKILRVNLDGTIPSDNPLVNETAVTACGPMCKSPVSATATAPPRTDIWAWGFRNPFRFSFDKQTGNFWVGDVGEVTWEEVNIVKKGKHYGWPWREGKFGLPNDKCAQVTPQSGDCVEPIFACNHSEGNCNSMTGGVIVDSCSWPAQWRGQYFFGDSDTGYVSALKINAARDNVEGTSPRTVVGRFGPPEPQFPVAFHLGPDGDLYVAIFNDTGVGRIAKISPIAPLACDAGTPDGGGAGGGSGGGAGGGGAAMPKGCGCGSVEGALALAALAFAVGRQRRKE